MKRSLESLFDRYRRRGDVAALGRVFDRASPALLRVALHVASSAAEAEDLVQETFLTAIARAENYDRNRPLKPWLVGILRNHARSMKRKRRPLLLSAIESSDQTSAQDVTNVAWTDTVSHAVELLPDPYRQVLVLRLCHDKQPAEIAMLLDRTPATVRSQIHRGLERLRDALPNDPNIRGLVIPPAGLGLAAIRESVVAKASLASHAAVASVTATSFIVGGLVVSKSMMAVGTLVLVGLALATGHLLQNGDSQSDRNSPVSGSTDLIGQDRASTAPTDAPQLRGSPPKELASSESSETEMPKDTPKVAESSWPPKVAIPADKGSVAGTITFEDGTPFAGARIALWGTPSGDCVSDEMGRYHIHADGIGDRAPHLCLGEGPPSARESVLLAHDVKMKGGELVVYDFVVRRGQTVASVVVDHQSGNPLENVKVTLRRTPSGAGQARAAFTKTDERGRFELPYIPVATYTIELELDGYQTCLHVVDLNESPLRDALTIKRALDLSIHFKNLPESARGQPLNCMLMQVGNPSKRPGSLSATKKAAVGQDDKLVLDAPEPGKYMLTIHRSKHLPRLVRMIDVPEGKPLSIEWILPVTSRVVGSLLDEEGKPLVGYQVRIGGAEGKSKTKENGLFEVIGVARGAQRFEVYAGTAWVHVATVNVQGADNTKREIRTSGSSTIEGRWLIGDRPVTKFKGHGWLKSKGQPRPIAQVRAGENGIFRIGMLPEGDYELRLWGRDAHPLTVAVHVSGTGIQALGDLVLQRLVRIPIQFIGLKSEGDTPPIRGFAFTPTYHRVAPTQENWEIMTVAETEARATGDMAFIRIEKDDAGDHWLANVPPGRRRLELEVAGGGYERAILEVDVKDGMTEPVEVVFVAGSNSK